MTNLTEQWKKGELPSGWYYVRLIRGEYRIDLYINGKNEWIDCPDNIIDTVVCKVPSFEEWQAKLEENAQLKELLKEVRGKLKYVNTPRNNHNIFANDLMKRIDQALGEE